MSNTDIQLYSHIALNRDFPEYNLKKGDIPTFIDTVLDPEGIEEGYILEVSNALGNLSMSSPSPNLLLRLYAQMKYFRCVAHCTGQLK